MRIHVINICYKKGSSNTTVQSYQPTAQEIRLQKQAADYAEAVSPNALWLNTVARNVLQDSLGTIQVDYNQLAQQATQQAQAAQQGVAGLTQGVLPSAYQQNMEASLMSGVNNTVGNAVNSLAQRGVLNSSVTNQAMNDISKNVSDTMAQQYQNNIATLNGLYGQQSSLAGTPITLNAAAQEAAQTPAINLWNASMGLNSNGTLGALNAVAGQGTTTSTQNTSGGSFLGGLFNTGLNAAASYYGAANACFTGDTKVKTPDGDKYIRHLEVADEVVAYNPETDSNEVAVVVEVMEPRITECYAVVCEKANRDKNAVFTTLTQPLLTEEGTFVTVDAMRIGTKLKGAGAVLGIIYSGERKVYDIKVSGPNTYYANGLIAKGGTTEW